jgi:hypothetical protein
MTRDWADFLPDANKGAPRPIWFNKYPDLRGMLRAMDLPFQAVRIFTISDVGPKTSRGGHAHRTCSQLLYSTSGHITGRIRGREWDLPTTFSERDLAILIPPLNWIDITEFSPDAVLVVLADEPYSLPITDFAELERLWAAK